jgi:hypothetical protein
MYGQNHRYCPTCGHAVRSSWAGCGSCGTPLGDLMMLDIAMDRNMCGPSIGFDPMDGQFAVNLGGGLAVEADGQVDMDVDGIDFPVS